jgi:hypothetical protein
MRRAELFSCICCKVFQGYSSNTDAMLHSLHWCYLMRDGGDWSLFKRSIQKINAEVNSTLTKPFNGFRPILCQIIKMNRPVRRRLSPSILRTGSALDARHCISTLWSCFGYGPLLNLVLLLCLFGAVCDIRPCVCVQRALLNLLANEIFPLNSQTILKGWFVCWFDVAFFYYPMICSN